MADVLPGDVLINIASRLPAKSVGRCRCISKLWCTSLSDPFFIRKHLNESNQRHSDLHPECVITMQLVADENRVGFFKEYYDNISPEPKFVELDNPFKEFSHPHSLHILGSCNGIVCLLHLCADIICLWNPCTGEYKKFPDVFSTKPSIHSSGEVRHWAFTSPCGFNYNSVLDDYELIRMSPSTSDNGRATYHHYVADVYSLAKNSCRRLGPLIYNSYLFYCSSGLFLNDALHWIGYGDLPMPIPLTIFAFKVGSEDIRAMTQLNHVKPYPMFGIEITELRGKLCIYWNRGDVWIMEEYGDPDWTTLYNFKDVTVDYVKWGYTKPLCYTSNGWLLLHNQGRECVLYDSQTHRGSVLNFGKNKILHAGIFTESLLRLDHDVYKPVLSIVSEKPAITYHLRKRSHLGPIFRFTQNKALLRYSRLVEQDLGS